MPVPDSHPTIRLGISACLLGQPVRYDGGHKLDSCLIGTLGRFVEWTPVCPEIEAGMGVPREPINLLGRPESPRLIGSTSGSDYTEMMQRWARECVERLVALHLHGFVLKADSPSCGLRAVPVRDERLVPHGTSCGLFAQALVSRFPLLPVEEEGRLVEDTAQKRFLERVHTYVQQAGGYSLSLA
jgi:uncharacterized protein YbbK (DUF523 family)